MASQIIVTQGNYGISIQTTFYKDGDIFNLTGKTLVLDIVKPDSTIISDKAVTIINDVSGIAEIILTPDITDVVGTYKLYYSVNDGASSITGQDIITYTVKPKDGGINAV